MIDRTPEVMSFPIYLHKDFIQVPLPVARLQAPCSSLFDLASELRPKPVPPVADRFMAYVHATFMKKVFHIPQREWKPYIKHNCNLNDLMTGFEIPKGYRIIHSCAAKSRINVKQVYFDRAEKIPAWLERGKQTCLQGPSYWAQQLAS